jgi:predicted nucleic acid-binding protein
VNLRVVDASAAIDLLVGTDRGRRVRDALAEDADLRLASVAHIDAEVLSGLARIHRAGDLSAGDVTALLEQLARMPMDRPTVTHRLLDDAWGLRDTVATRDALYVAAARRLGARLITTDGRLARAAADVVVAL